MPKWDKRCTTGLFLGFSEHHSSTVSLVLNTFTGSTTPQFHVVHDELYTSIISAPNLNLQIIYEQLHQISSESDWEAELNEFGKEVPAPSLHVDWLDDEEMEKRRDIEILRYRRLYGKDISSPTLPSSSHSSDNFQISESNSLPEVITESDPPLEEISEVDSPVKDVIGEIIIPPTKPQQSTDSFSLPSPTKHRSKRHRTKTKTIFNEEFVQSCHCVHSNLGYKAELNNWAFLQYIDWNEVI